MRAKAQAQRDQALFTVFIGTKREKPQAGFAP
jgi:hypothetical protein